MENFEICAWREVGYVEFCVFNLDFHTFFGLKRLWTVIFVIINGHFVFFCFPSALQKKWIAPITFRFTKYFTFWPLKQSYHVSLCCKPFEYFFLSFVGIWAFYANNRKRSTNCINNTLDNFSYFKDHNDGRKIFNPIYHVPFKRRKF